MYKSAHQSSMHTIPTVLMSSKLNFYRKNLKSYFRKLKTYIIETRRKTMYAWLKLAHIHCFSSCASFNHSPSTIQQLWWDLVLPENVLDGETCDFPHLQIE